MMTGVIMRNCLNPTSVTSLACVMYSNWPGEFRHGELHVPEFGPIIAHVLITVVVIMASPNIQHMEDLFQHPIDLPRSWSQR